MIELYVSPNLVIRLGDSGNLFVQAAEPGRWRLSRAETMELARKLKDAIGEQASAGCVMPFRPESFTFPLTPEFLKLADCDDLHMKPRVPNREPPHLVLRIRCAKCLRNVVVDSIGSLPKGWERAEGTQYRCPRCVE